MKRWKPKEKHGHHYFFDGRGVSSTCFVEGDGFDKKRIRLGNCFRIYSQAEEFAKRIKKLAREFHKEVGE